MEYLAASASHPAPTLRPPSSVQAIRSSQDLSPSAQGRGEAGAPRVDAHVRHDRPGPACDHAPPVPPILVTPFRGGPPRSRTRLGGASPDRRHARPDGPCVECTPLHERPRKVRCQSRADRQAVRPQGDGNGWRRNQCLSPKDFRLCQGCRRRGGLRFDNPCDRSNTRDHRRDRPDRPDRCPRPVLRILARSIPSQSPFEIAVAENRLGGL